MSEIILVSDDAVLIDVIDIDLAEFTWYIDNGYVSRNVHKPNGKQTKQFIHRVILARIAGRELYRNELTDHINGNPLDNRRCNLRIATHAENMRNRKKNNNSVSGYKGVSWRRAANKWCVQIRNGGKKIYLGLFDDPIEAARVYDAAALELHGKFARLNFPIAQEASTP